MLFRSSSDGLLLDSKLEDITIDTKSPVITTVTFDSLIKNNTSITSGTPGYDDTRAQPGDTVIFKITSNEPLYEISTSDVTIDRMSVSSVTPNEDFTEWTVTSEVIDAETSEDGPISYSITSYTDAAGNLGSSDGLLVDSKLEDITIDTKSPEITSVTFDSLIKNNTSITSSTLGYDDTRAQPNDTFWIQRIRLYT